MRLLPNRIILAYTDACISGAVLTRGDTTMDYFVANSNGAPYGPYSLQQLRDFAREGRVTPTSLVRQASSSDWAPAQTIIDFGPPAAPPPPVPMPPIAPSTAPNGMGGTTPASSDAALGLLIPVQVDPIALVAGYVGLFSLLLVPAPIALGIGIWALVRLKGRTGIRGAGRAWTAIVLGLLGTIGLVALATAMMSNSR